jgi:NTE family protein
MTRRPRLALVLSGGGARAAYQVGVLQAVAERVPTGARIPFAVLCGTSAGAINAAALAAGAFRFDETVERLRSVWTGLHVGDVFRADPWSLVQRALGLAGSLLGRRRPASLLDSAPLGGFLRRAIRFEAIGEALEAGAIEALAVTAHAYRSGLSVTFCQGRGPDAAWERSQRVGVPTHIGVDHLLASCAIPLVFPPAAVDGEWYGDGAVRQIAPTAPALHLGADRILVVGAHGRLRHPAASAPGAPPSTAQIGSQVLAGMFTDALGTDLEKVRLVNAAVRQIDPAALRESPVPLRDVALLEISPAVALEEMALEHFRDLPRGLRLLLGGVGVGGSGGGGLLSYVLFEPGYCRALLELGRADADRRGAEIDALLDGAI